MTETKFTPDQWIAVDEGRGRDRSWCVMVPEESRFGPYIATIHNTADHAKANSHLIAAAPELYKIADIVSRLPIRDDLPDDVPVIGVYGVYITQGDVREARKITTKARGES